MRRRTLLGTLGTLISGCSSRRERTVDPTGPVDPADNVKSVETQEDTVLVTMTGTPDTDFAITTVKPIRNPERSPLALSRDQIAGFPVLRSGLAYFSYDYDAVEVKSRIDVLSYRNWLESHWENHRAPDVPPRDRPFRLVDAVFSVRTLFYP